MKNLLFIALRICGSVFLAGILSCVAALGASLIEGDLVPTPEKTFWGCVLIGFAVIIFLTAAIPIYKKDGLKKLLLLYLLPFWLFAVPFTLWLY